MIKKTVDITPVEFNSIVDGLVAEQKFGSPIEVYSLLSSKVVLIFRDDSLFNRLSFEAQRHDLRLASLIVHYLLINKIHFCYSTESRKFRSVSLFD